MPKAYGHVVALNEDGKVPASMQEATGAYPETATVTERVIGSMRRASMRRVWNG